MARFHDSDRMGEFSRGYPDDCWVTGEYDVTTFLSDVPCAEDFPYFDNDHEIEESEYRHVSHDAQGTHIDMSQSRSMQTPYGREETGVEYRTSVYTQGMGQSRTAASITTSYSGEYEPVSVFDLPGTTENPTGHPMLYLPTHDSDPELNTFPLQSLPFFDDIGCEGGQCDANGSSYFQASPSSLGLEPLIADFKNACSAESFISEPPELFTESNYLVTGIENVDCFGPVVADFPPDNFVQAHFQDEFKVIQSQYCDLMMTKTKKANTNTVTPKRQDLGRTSSHQRSQMLSDVKDITMQEKGSSVSVKPNSSLPCKTSKVTVDTCAKSDDDDTDIDKHSRLQSDTFSKKLIEARTKVNGTDYDRSAKKPTTKHSDMPPHSGNTTSTANQFIMSQKEAAQDKEEPDITQASPQPDSWTKLLIASTKCDPDKMTTGSSLTNASKPIARLSVLAPKLGSDNQDLDMDYPPSPVEAHGSDARTQGQTNKLVLVKPGTTIEEGPTDKYTRESKQDQLSTGNKDHSIMKNRNNAFDSEAQFESLVNRPTSEGEEAISEGKCRKQTVHTSTTELTVGFKKEIQPVECHWPTDPYKRGHVEKETHPGNISTQLKPRPAGQSKPYPGHCTRGMNLGKGRI